MGACWPGFKSGTIFYLLFLRENYSPPPENNTRTSFFFVVFAGYSFFSKCFYPVSLSSIMHQLCFLFGLAFCFIFFFFFFFSGRMSCFISVLDSRKKKTWLAVCQPLCVLCRGFTELRKQQKLTVDSFTLKKTKRLPLCCRSMRGDIIVQYR